MTNAKISNSKLYELMDLFYSLGDGTIWNPIAGVAAFETKENAKKFFNHAPSWWTIRFKKQKPMETQI